jgi:phosphomannomutase
MMSVTGEPLSRLVGERMKRYPASGEINRKVPDAADALRRVRASFEPNALRIDETDGIGIEFERWRFNLRSSNTEPLVRLNVESRGDETLMRDKTSEVLRVLGGES